MTATPVTIKYGTVLYQLKDWVILPVPEVESVKLPSRGQVSVTVAINTYTFDAVLEPDGRWSHWLHVTANTLKNIGVKAGDTVHVTMTTRSVWPEPTLPRDFKEALDTAPQKVKEKWQNITAMARWEWLRWVNATGSTDTRAIRIEKTISKLNGKHRRPCCFNLAACTEPYVAKNARLLEIV